MLQPRKSARKPPTGRPFQPGNAGKPQGARHKTTIAIEQLMAGDAEAITAEVIRLAKGGDLIAAKLVLDRVAPVRRGRPIYFDPGPIDGPQDVHAALSKVLRAVASGELTPEEAHGMCGLLDVARASAEGLAFNEQLRRIEERLANGRK